MLRNFLDILKKKFPVFFRAIFYTRDFFFIYFPARLNLKRIYKSHSAQVNAFYLTTRFPKAPVTRSGHTHGGSVKLTYLAEVFPHHFPAANLAYIVATVGHPLRAEILKDLKSKGLKFVVNQDGVAFPAWAGNRYIEFNQLSKHILDQSDLIIYQSHFSKLSADLYLSPPQVPNKIVYNPVDTNHFSPQSVKKPKELTLLLGGNQYEKYRLELALQTLHSLLKFIPVARLIVTGTLWQPEPQAWAWTKAALKEMNMTDHVEFVGKYTQLQAPQLYSQAHMLIHTKYADPCPGLVPESLGCGLPVVYVGNGGVPELVEDAGISVPVEHSWETINLPAPKKMAEAVIQVYDNLKHYSQAARVQAQKFALDKFVAKHKEIFEEVLSV